MAARKKVTKKASKPPERGNPIRQRGTKKRSQAADSKTSRGAAASKSVGKRGSPNLIPAASSKKGSSAVAPTSKARAGAKLASQSHESAAVKETAAKDTAAPKGVAIVNASVRKAATAPRKTAGAGDESQPKADQSKDVNREGAKAANPGRGRSEPVAAAGLAEKAAKAPAVVAAMKPAASAAVSQGVAKAAKAAQPARAIDREPSGGEQKTMKNSANKHGFKLNEFVVYPAHGVGQIVSMEEQEVAGFKLELFVINFVKDKMTLRVPTSKVAGVGMRKLSDADGARRSLEILTGRARVKRTMWSRRAQEYEAKINSGDINAIAEVVRDLYRSEAQPEQSYSERQLYEAALDRMMREIAAVQKLSETEALKVIDTQLKKNQKRGVKADAAEGDEAGIEEAA